MDVLVVAAHDAVLVDHLRTVVQDAIHAAEVRVVITHLPEESRSDDPLLLWRSHRSIHHLTAFLSDPSIQSLHPSASTDRVANNPTSTSGENDPNATATTALLKRIHKRDRKIKSLTHSIEDLESQLADALARARFIEHEQEQFFADVQHMKEAYDKLHASHQKLLWEYLPSKDRDLQSIPALTRQLEESERAIGPYPLGDVLGYGQYATVFASFDVDNPHKRLAVKAIDKEKLIDLVTLHRVNAEIASLQDPAIQHHGILTVRAVFHTPRHIYLVTECGGKDLFEYFGPHEEGVPEATIQTLMGRVLLAVETLHHHQYCHRDLKPENILYDPDHASPTEIVKVVDFGLCTKVSSLPDGTLHDFCGSPGFFAPEILLCDSYDGQKADVWSLGCILLELVLGNDRFATLWMAMYELETLRDHVKFRTLVQSSLEAVSHYFHSSAWTYSPILRSLLLNLLCENPKDRPTVTQILGHAWFHDPLQSPGSSLAKPPLLPACVSFSESCLALPHEASSTRRPVSADHDPIDNRSPHVSVLLSLAPGSPPASRPVTPKLLLPSLSPEKPNGARSPDKSFAKRMPSISPTSTSTSTSTPTPAMPLTGHSRTTPLQGSSSHVRRSSRFDYEDDK